MNKDDPDFIIVVCEGKTEVLYFNILKRQFRIPTYVKILPEIDEDEYRNFGQHEKLIAKAVQKREEYKKELEKEAVIEAWAVCDRDEYNDSFTKLRGLADEQNINLAFSDPQFENFLLQHFSQNKSKNRKGKVERELSEEILKAEPWFGLYNKADLNWLREMIDKKHAVADFAIRNADVFNNHTKQPFFTVQKLVKRLIDLV